MFEEDRIDKAYAGGLGVLIILVILVLILFLICRSCEIKPTEANEIDNLLPIIAMAESSYGLNLYGDNGKSLGKYQICEAVVIDYNRANGTNYKHSDLLKNEISEKIVRWHLKRIIRLLKRKGIYSKAKIVQVWNEGFIALKRPIPKSHKNKIYAGIYQGR